MASSINPSNVDGTYPVAGQDNDSQGFRDNFTNIKTNFTSAKTEIEALQTTSVTLSATNDFNFTGVISEALMKNNADVVNALGTVGGSVTLDHATGIIHTATLNASGTLAFSNWPASGKGGRMRFMVTISNVAHTLTLPAAVTLGATTVQGISSLVVTFPATGTYIYDFSSVDGGTSILVEDKTQSDASLGNLQLNANVISSTNTNGNITLTPNGTGVVTTDNLSLDGNTVATTNANGNLVLTPNGTGTVDLSGTTATISTSASNQALALAPAGTGAVNVPAGYKDRAGHGTNSLTTKEYVDATVASGTIANIPLAADSGTSETIINGNTLTISGGTNVSTVSSSADTITVNLDTAVAGLTTLTVDQININGNTIISTDTNGHINLDPNGTGRVIVAAANTLEAATIATASGGNTDMTVAPDGTGSVLIGGTNRTISTTGTNTDLNINPNGTGKVVISTEATITTLGTPATNTNLSLAPHGTGTVDLVGTTATISTSTTNQDLKLNPNGTGTVDFNVPVQTTVGSAGGASAVPATPTTYMKIEVGGTAYVVPCFAVS
jgi:hypothetical protein